MANLSNINGYFNVTDTGLVNVVNGGLYVTKSSGDAIIGILSSGGNGRPYYLRSNTNGNFAIYDDTACLERLIIASGGDVTISKNLTVTGNTVTLDSSASAGFIVDRANDTSGATYEYKTNGSLKWYTGLRGVSTEDFYLFNNAQGSTALLISSSNNNAAFGGNVTATGVYTAGNSAIIYKAQRSGGAVAGDWSYDDATTDMSLGTSTAHSFSLKTGNTRALTIDTSQNTSFAGNIAAGVAQINVINNQANSANIIYRSGTTTIIGGGSSSNKLYVLDNGDVGVNVSSPVAKLQVDGNIALHASSNAPYIDFVENGATSDSKARITMDQIDTNNGELIFSTEGSGTLSTVLTLDSNQNTIVSGPFWIQEYIYHHGDADTYIRALPNEWILRTGGSDRLTISDSNTYFTNTNVGIGTTLPVAKFEVTDGSSSIALQEYNNGAAIFLDGVNGDFIGGDYFHILADSNSYLGLGGYGGGTTPLNITNAGNVGIGTTSPTSPAGVARFLEIEGTTAGIALHDNGNDPYEIWASGGNLVFRYNNTGGENGMLLSSSGNLGIGTTSPSAKLDVSGSSALFMTRASAGLATYIENDGGYAALYMYQLGGGQKVKIHTNASSFFNGGNVGIGTSSPSAPLQVHGQQKWYTTNADGNELRGFFNPGGSGDDAELSLYIADGATEGIVWRAAGNSYVRVDSTSLKFLNFYYGGSNVGAIVTGGSNVLYQSYSDYRLKENIIEMTGALNKVSQLKPKIFNYISTPEITNEGFLAHELQEIVPQAVSGEKDDVDEKGTPQYQGVDNAHIVPLLVGAIKELKEEIEILKTQINN